MNIPFIPERASNFADQIDLIFYTLTILTVIFTVIVLAAMAFLTLRYQRGNKVDRSNPQHHNLPLEIAWSTPPLFLGLAVFVWAAIPYTQIFRAPDNAMEIFVIGKRWMWHMQHSNGVRENNELHLPVGVPVRINLISQDVIHGLFVPAFRVKRDALPGRYNQMWFTPTKTGKFHLFCTEFCGTGHSQMGGWVYVMEPAEFQAWLQNEGKKVVMAKQTPEMLGQVLYDQLACGGCHDHDALGGGPSLVGLYGSKVRLKDGRTVIADANYLRNSIINSSEDIVERYQQVMPSYKDQLTEEQLLNIIAYIKSLDAPARAPASLEMPTEPAAQRATSPLYKPETPLERQNYKPGITPMTATEPNYKPGITPLDGQP
jgi:cytochrome c oxidase subunit 2